MTSLFSLAALLIYMHINVCMCLYYQLVENSYGNLVMMTVFTSEEERRGESCHY